MTPASDARPTVRAVRDRHGDGLVVEVGERVCTIRPKHARKGGPAEVTVPWGAVYVRCLEHRAASVRGRR